MKIFDLVTGVLLVLLLTRCHLPEKGWCEWLELLSALEEQFNTIHRSLEVSFAVQYFSV